MNNQPFTGGQHLETDANTAYAHGTAWYSEENSGGEGRVRVPLVSRWGNGLPRR